MTFDEFCDKHKVTIRTRDRGPAAGYHTWGHYAMKCTLRLDGRQITTPFRQGLAHDKPPTAAEVLACLISDAQSVLSAGGFAEWCGDLGCDSDSISARDTYHACKLTMLKLRRFLGEDYEAFVTAAEDY